MLRGRAMTISVNMGIGYAHREIADFEKLPNAPQQRIPEHINACILVCYATLNVFRQVFVRNML